MMLSEEVMGMWRGAEERPLTHKQVLAMTPEERADIDPIQVEVGFVGHARGIHAAGYNAAKNGQPREYEGDRPNAWFVGYDWYKLLQAEAMP